MTATQHGEAKCKQTDKQLNLTGTTIAHDAIASHASLLICFGMRKHMRNDHNTDAQIFTT